MTSGVFATLKEKQQQRQVERAAAWTAFVVGVADGQVTDPDEILSSLDRLGKTAGDLEAAVGRLRARRELARQLAEREAAETELADLQQQLAAADRELESLIAKHHAKHQPTQTRMEKCRERVVGGRDVRRDLIDSVSAETRMAVLGDIENGMAELQQRQATAEKSLADSERWLQSVESFGASASSKDQANIPGMRQQRQRLQVELRQIASEQQQLADRRSVAERELLRPDLL